MNTAAAQVARPRAHTLRLMAWAAGPAAIAGVHFALLDLHPIARMWALVFVLFFWMKAVVLVERNRAGKPLPRPFAAWLMLWPGMRPVARAVSPRLAHALNGLASVTIGVGLILAARFAWAETSNLWLTAPLLLAACSLILHYGLFAIVTAAWRTAGFSAGPLFRNPFAARSLADFWGRRWNLAYVEMCQETLVRALRGDCPRPRLAEGLSPSSAATATSRRRGQSRIAGTVPFVFLFSGLLHEVAISLPVSAGYGLPTLYFALNGGAMLLGSKLREGSVAARLWAAFWIIAPLPLLFHPWFLHGVVLPMVGIT